METAARFARAGNRVLGWLAALLIVVMFLYGGYSLWDTAMTYRGAFVSGDLLKFKPASAQEEANPTLNELMAINEDARAWLTIDDTHIDYPVVQGEDDMEYVNKDVYGDFSLSGAIFMDSRAASDFTDSYTLVYGHHMDNGGMFGDVVEFTDAAYFSAHTTGTLYLPLGTRHITLFACVETDAYDSAVYNTSLYAGGEIGSLLDYIRDTANQYREIGLTAEDRVIGLSTCAEAATNGRVILFGRLDPISQAQEGGAK